MKHLFVFLLYFVTATNVFAQDPSLRGGGRNNVGGVADRIKGYSSAGQGGGGNLDSVKKRNKFEDSITISYRLINNPQQLKLDSSINDYIRSTWQPQNIVLGNNGAPTKTILFNPIMTAGFDEGKHSLDAYRWTIDKVKFYNTTRPYTELAYVIGSKAEQNLQLTHTQNVRQDFNFAFDYRLISAPGYFRNNKNNHGNLVLNSHYVSKKKRYANWFVALSNNFKHSDYGGVNNLADLNDPIYKDRNIIETNLTKLAQISANPFDRNIESGQLEKDRTIMLKQSYDFGKKDSIIINDSTTKYLFYSKLRLEHTITNRKQFYGYRGFVSDSSFYKSYSTIDSVFTKSLGSFENSDAWQQWSNDFSVYSYPDTKNTNQYIKAGITFQNYNGLFKQGLFKTNSRQFNNLATHFDYKNITRNKKWDLDANAILYVSGYNSGDYEATASLILLGNSKLGNIKLKATNVSRTPSFIFYNESAFNYSTISNIKKENNTEFTAQVFNEKKQQNITVQLLTSNSLTTWQTFKTFKQEALFNMLKLNFSRSFKVYKKIMLHTEIHAQQVIIGNPKINYPKLYTRNRIAYEGNLGKKNLRLATGLEFRYIAPYNLDAWSPLTSQFVYQNTTTSKNNLPDINAYLHFNITSFNAFIRVENINTFRVYSGTVNDGISFTNQNFAAVRYPNPGLLFRFGVYWRFIN